MQCRIACGRRRRTATYHDDAVLHAIAGPKHAPSCAPCSVSGQLGGALAAAKAATGVDERTRLIVELEFVQCLANPFYLNCELPGCAAISHDKCGGACVRHVAQPGAALGGWPGATECMPQRLGDTDCKLSVAAATPSSRHAAGLSQNRYLEDPAFLNYLKYLEYWRQPQYAKYIR